jgi:hypothetical protein
MRELAGADRLSGEAPVGEGAPAAPCTVRGPALGRFQAPPIGRISLARPPGWPCRAVPTLLALVAVRAPGQRLPLSSSSSIIIDRPGSAQPGRSGRHPLTIVADLGPPYKRALANGRSALTHPDRPPSPLSPSPT